MEATGLWCLVIRALTARDLQASYWYLVIAEGNDMRDEDSFIYCIIYCTISQMVEGAMCSSCACRGLKEAIVMHICFQTQHWNAKYPIVMQIRTRSLKSKQNETDQLRWWETSRPSWMSERKTSPSSRSRGKNQRLCNVVLLSLYFFLMWRARKERWKCSRPLVTQTQSLCF